MYVSATAHTPLPHIYIYDTYMHVMYSYVHYYDKLEFLIVPPKDVFQPLPQVRSFTDFTKKKRPWFFFKKNLPTGLHIS